MAGTLTKLKTVVWGKIPTDPVERRLLFKMDWFILSYCCLMYWVNYLDRANLANAYVSGMQVDLNMKGNEFNLINTCFNVGYIVALVPHNLVLLRVRPRYWLSFCMLVWGVLTLSLYKATSFKQMCAIRFFVAVFESATFTGVHLILGSYYDEELLPFRTAVFTSSGLVGSIFSSVMQAAIYENMDDYRGIRGWRWLFIIDFIVTVPVVIYGFFFFPDAPEISKPFYFTEEEHQLALKKSQDRKHVDSFSWSVFKRIFGRWHWYLFSFLWVLGGENESFASNSLFALWLKYFEYTVPQRNHYPMGVFAVGITATLLSALYLNATGGKNHWHIGIIIMCAMILSAILMAARPLSTGVVFFAQYLGGIPYAGQTAFFAWANVVCQDDLQERAVVLASMNMFSNAVNAWWSLLFYVASDVPKFRKGCWAMLATAIASGILVCEVARAKHRFSSKPQPRSCAYRVVD
ncbi:Pantothenate transporter FEN2 (Fenpropimorph resistance protein 2) [Scheffersomyces stipitis CBS 6054]|uniref:Pantothenate transporter FEN2 (Fenpropimorph resistance protein 2) n=1 Tax=Scheffersomyces stipitis (strain ATCC 58785 / CBS 6054 / NBRC 10063 / NRRL Y-11545) TaxID=322104 RepID=A3LT71_PICST|nr:Pantothenate transporter FEN2 (Fenpropimorph resistance protein 2) [Scheffersomyces stipitis CBS 6054]ABN66021.2 Pantothenate transporter FEN2 (Fenpropimorph resistance protein 2) [Scheffersomyces stipitis CBS 6054]